MKPVLFRTIDDISIYRRSDGHAIVRLPDGRFLAESFAPDLDGNYNAAVAAAWAIAAGIPWGPIADGPASIAPDNRGHDTAGYIVAPAFLPAFAEIRTANVCAVWDGIERGERELAGYSTAAIVDYGKRWRANLVDELGRRARNGPRTDDRHVATAIGFVIAAADALDGRALGAGTSFGNLIFGPVPELCSIRTEIYLRGVGSVPAIDAVELRPGMILPLEYEPGGYEVDGPVVERAGVVRINRRSFATGIRVAESVPADRLIAVDPRSLATFGYR